MKFLPILWIPCNFQTVSSRSINENYKIAGRYQFIKNVESDSMHFRIKTDRLWSSKCAISSNIFLEHVFLTNRFLPLKQTWIFMTHLLTVSSPENDQHLWWQSVLSSELLIPQCNTMHTHLTLSYIIFFYLTKPRLTHNRILVPVSLSQMKLLPFFPLDFIIKIGINFLLYHF